MIEPIGSSAIEIAPAEASDAAALTSTSIRSFHDDAVRFGGAKPGDALSGPPGYDSDGWHLSMMKRGRCYVIRQAGAVVGGIIVFPLGGSVCNLGRIWLDPEAQGRGIGRAAIEWLHGAWPDISKWTLETPAWAVRNHHLYESLGYRRVGEVVEPDGFRQFLYERETAPKPTGESLGSTATR